jgi:hypothetical protein
MLADTVFGNSSYAELHVAGVESYGNSLILDFKGRARKISCAGFDSVLASARDTGFTEVAFLSSNTGSATICTTKPSDMTRKSPLYISASQIKTDANSSGTDSGDAEVDQSALAPSTNLKARIIESAKAQGTPIQSILIENRRIEVAFFNSRYRTQSEAIGRLLRVLMAEAPPDIEEFRIVNIIGATPTTALLFRRSDIERVSVNYGSAYELLPLTDITDDSGRDPLVAQHTEISYPQFGWGIAPGYRQSLFDPKNPYLFQVYAGLSGSVDFNEHLSLLGGVEMNIYNDFNSTGRVSNSLLPHVRSDFNEYVEHGATGIGVLEAMYTTKLSSDVYARGRVGYLEDMYAGVGGEILWRPLHSRWAFGGDIYAVHQRAFNRLFDFRDYSVITGHAGVYYDSPFHGFNFALYAGRYLAGDYGATFEIRRRFASGVEIGVYATLTNVPFKTFGEGSFDKGFIIRIPLDFMAPINTQQVAALDFSPLTRDGGQRLANDQTLYYDTDGSSEGSMLETWNHVLNP